MPMCQLGDVAPIHELSRAVNDMVNKVSKRVKDVEVCGDVEGYEDVEEVCEDVAKAFRQKVETAGARWSAPAKSVSGREQRWRKE